MEKYILIKPTLEYKQDAIAYIKECIHCNSEIHGAGGLKRYLDNYEAWLEKLDKYENIPPDEEAVPSLEYFLIRCSDKKIVGMVNLRLVLNENLRKSGGHIGYSIRPEERGKGYAKLQLYLTLLKCGEFKIEQVMISCVKENEASSRTIKALGGKLVREEYDPNYNAVCSHYLIDVNKAIDTYKNQYMNLMEGWKKNER